MHELLPHFSFAVAQAAVFHLPHADMLNVILLGTDRTASFQDERPKTFFSEFFRGPSTGDAGADYDCIIDLVRHFGLHYALLESSTGRQPPCWVGMISYCNSCWAPISDV